MDLRIVSIGAVQWTDVATVFGSRGDPASCWCQYFKVTNAEFGATPRDVLCDALRSQVTDEPGLLAYLDEEPVGWIAVESRTRYPTLRRGRVTTASTRSPDLDHGGLDRVWAVTCFVVRVGFRRRGIGRALLTAAVDHARSRGARALEGYPIDVQERGTVSSADLYHGTLSLFEGAGFEVDARPSLGRAVVSLSL
jgi:GNAT superfamily N-acetyltransferase